MNRLIAHEAFVARAIEDARAPVDAFVSALSPGRRGYVALDADRVLMTAPAALDARSGVDLLLKHMHGIASEAQATDVANALARGRDATGPLWWILDRSLDAASKAPRGGAVEVQVHAASGSTPKWHGLVAGTASRVRYPVIEPDTILRSIHGQLDAVGQHVHDAVARSTRLLDHPVSSLDARERTIDAIEAAEELASRLSGRALEA